jgi:hypothetical protein
MARVQQRNPNIPSTAPSLAAARPASQAPTRPTISDELIAAKEKLVEDLGGFAGHLEGRARAYCRARGQVGLDNIVCIYIGNKKSGGRYTGQKAVKIQVRHKVGNSERIEQTARIPATIQVGNQTYPTDVEEVGGHIIPYQFLTPQDFRKLEHPVLCGSSLGPAAEALSGTIGCLVVVSDTLCILSCNHVLARVNQGQTGSDLIVQPGGADAPLNVAQKIGTLMRFIQLNLYNVKPNPPLQPSVVDAAVASTSLRNDPAGTGPIDLSSFEHHTYVIDPQWVPFQPNMPVLKEGRTTGLTRGQIVGTHATVYMDYGPPPNGGGPYSYMENQLVIQGFGGHFSEPGDSGALIVTDDGVNSPVALLFSGTRDFTMTYAHPIKDVIDALGIQKFVHSEADLA